MLAARVTAGSPRVKHGAPPVGRREPATRVGSGKASASRRLRRLFAASLAAFCFWPLASGGPGPPDHARGDCLMPYAAVGCVTFADPPIFGLYGKGRNRQNTSLPGAVSDLSYVKSDSPAAQSQGRAAAVKDDRLQQQGVLNVRKSHLMAVFAACAAASLVGMSLVGGPALAQRPGMPQVSSTTVLIDILYIFKHHDGFKAEDGANEGRRATSARAVQARRRGDCGSSRRNWQDFRPGTPDYKAAQEEYARRVADSKPTPAWQKQDLDPSRRADLQSGVPGDPSGGRILLREQQHRPGDEFQRRPDQPGPAQRRRSHDHDSRSSITPSRSTLRRSSCRAFAHGTAGRTFRARRRAAGVTPNR